MESHGLVQGEGPFVRVGCVHQYTSGAPPRRPPQGVQCQGTAKTLALLVGVHSQSLEKSLGDSMGALNLTLQQIKGYIDGQDKRNTAADQLHAEHGTRITAMEATLNQAQPVATKADTEVRLRSLERFKYTLLGAVVVVNAAAGFIEYLATHH